MHCNMSHKNIVIIYGYNISASSLIMEVMGVEIEGKEVTDVGQLKKKLKDDWKWYNKYN